MKEYTASIMSDNEITFMPIIAQNESSMRFIA